ncbi:PP2C family protein-serine/threonine phosphatase [Gloeocapsa sp. PCC 73106]|uniref:PP2C family protein-serine/threonine phosphatase n=1 Tax=Gloeocapsa sp. PCC 73106 TaxID=102232 RepID=UPI0002AD1341|nr:PP2C family protein-serine/threonine phosphatase [Gloeocapsa sp. PCC 73106]ELR97547.1 serine phosphatase RsbU, regulator of sigma subunit [Gloeocapsa sp. PCC 73106]
MLNKIAHLAKSRLSRKISFWLFTSVIVIETIILIPSLIRRQREMLTYLTTISTEKVLVLSQFFPHKSPDQEVLNILEKLQINSVILGGSLYQANGQLIGSFGEPPELTFADVLKNQQTKLFDHPDSRYDVAWTSLQPDKNYTLILRHDATSVKQELTNFVFRISGLVIIISLFVTAGTFVTLQSIIITPILHLRRDLIKAGNCICDDQDVPEFLAVTSQQNDELGDVINTFEGMYFRISEAIGERKKAEVALQISYQEISEYSERLNIELEKGRQIQINFLPSSKNINYISVEYGWDIATFFQPARQVSGDFYDVFKLGDTSLGIVIADVCDKGVGAALFMALFRSLIRVFSQQSNLKKPEADCLALYQPQNGWLGSSSCVNLAHANALQALTLTNDYIVHNHGTLGMFATIFFGSLDLKTGLLSYINAGHESLFILNPKTGIRKILDSTGPAVGIIPNNHFSLEQTYLYPGEILFGYTDGVPDARADDGTFFSNGRLRSLLQTNFTNAKEVIEKVALDVLTHTESSQQFDDITLLAIKNENPSA